MLQTPDGSGRLELFEYLDDLAMETQPTLPNEIGMHRVRRTRALVSLASKRTPEDDGTMPAPRRPGLRIDSRLTIPESELSWRFSRSSGPGGQGVNTSDSRAELVWDVTRSAVLSEHQRDRLLQRLSGRLVDGVLTIAASEHRSQLRNRDAARARLAVLVSEALRPPSPTRRPTRPSRGAKERRLDAKKRRTDVKRLRRPPRD
jgi:ribosome-associated protein